MNENIQLNIAKLQTYFEELEKRIKSVERQMTTQNQVSAIQSCLAEIKDVLLEYQSTYSELVSEYNTHKQDYDQKVSTNTTEHSKFTSSISTLNANVLTLQTNLESLITRVTSLENSSSSGQGSTGGVSCLCKNTSDYCFNYVNCYLYNEQFYSPNFVMLANSSQYVDIKVKVQIKCASVVEDNQYTVKLQCNEKDVISKSYNYHTDTQTQELCYRFVPTKNSNTVRVVVLGKRVIKLDNYSIEINGRDVMLDANMPALKIKCFNDKYYIVKYDNNNGIVYYGVQDKNSLNLNETSLSSFLTDQNSQYSFIDYMLLPALQKGEQFAIDTENYPSGIKLYMLGLEQFRPQYTYKFNTTLNSIILDTQMNAHINRYDVCSYSNNIGYLYLGFVDYAYKVTGKSSSNFPIYINEALTEKFYNVAIVQYNYAKVGDDVEPFHGIITQREDGMWFFYPEIANKTKDNSTRIELSVGCNCTAYYQTNGNINVYIGNGTKVYKYTLTKNTTTNKYEKNALFDTISGVTKYEELLDGKALAYTYDSYQIVDM